MYKAPWEPQQSESTILHPALNPIILQTIFYINTLTTTREHETHFHTSSKASPIISRSEVFPSFDNAREICWCNMQSTSTLMYVDRNLEIMINIKAHHDTSLTFSLSCSSERERSIDRFNPIPSHPILSRMRHWPPGDIPALPSNKQSHLNPFFYHR